MVINFVSPKTNSTRVHESGFSSEVQHNSLHFNIPTSYGWGIKPVHFLTYDLRQEIVVTYFLFLEFHKGARTVQDRWSLPYSP